MTTISAAFRGDGPRPQIVCLCGSTRFYDEYQQAYYDLTMLGQIVLSVGFYPHAKAEHGHGEGVGHDSTDKVALDELHKRKIDLADYVFVLNVGGYIGDSTRSEIDYALRWGKPVRYLDPALNDMGLAVARLLQASEEVLTEAEADHRESVALKDLRQAVLSAPTDLDSSGQGPADVEERRA